MFMGTYKQKRVDKSTKIDFFKRKAYLRGLEPTPEEFRETISGLFTEEVVDEIMAVRSEMAFRSYCNKHGILEGGKVARGVAIRGTYY